MIGWSNRWGFAGSQLPCLVCMRRRCRSISAAVTAVAGLGWQVGCSDEAAGRMVCLICTRFGWIGEMGIGGDAPVSGFDCDG
jgi:hypothetical protein